MDLSLEDGCKAFLNVLESPVAMNLRTIVDLDSVEKSICTIQEKINKLVACQQALRGVHNALVPISRLPREVLSHIIFDFFVHESSESWRYARLCLLLTKVCRQWRRLAIANPSLWTRPPMYRYTKLSQMMLERSGKMPLSITLCDSSEQALQVLTQVSRFRELSIRASTDDLIKLLAAITEPLPLVERLELHHEGRSTAVAQLRNGPLEDVQNSRLKTLSLENCTLPWTSACIIGLTSLSISMESGHQYDDVRIPYTDLLQIIRQNPDLVELHLRRSLSTQSIDRDSTSPDVVLASRLEKLVITGEMHSSSLSCLLASVKAPRLLTVNLPDINTSNDPEPDALFVSLRKFTEAVDVSIQIQSAAFTLNAEVFYDSPRLRLQVDVSCARANTDQTFKFGLFFATIADATLSDDGQNLLTSFLRCLPVDCLHDLSIRTKGAAGHLVSLTNLWTAVSTLPNLSVLTVEHGKRLGVDEDLLVALEPKDKDLTSFPTLQKFTYKTVWSKGFRKSFWRKALLSFVQAAVTRAEPSQDGEPACTYTLHQTWPNDKSRQPDKQADICVRGMDVTGNFERIDAVDNGLDYVIQHKQSKPKGKGKQGR